MLAGVEGSGAVPRHRGSCLNSETLFPNCERVVVSRGLPELLPWPTGLQAPSVQAGPGVWWCRSTTRLTGERAGLGSVLGAGIVLSPREEAEVPEGPASRRSQHHPSPSTHPDDSRPCLNL